MSAPVLVERGLSLLYLKECFALDETTGILVWRTRPRAHFSSDRGWNIFNALFSQQAAGTPNKGYIQVQVLGKLFHAHRIIFALANNRWPSKGMDVDHINGVRSDNRPSNLRELSRRHNMQNLKRARADNKSTGVLGVHLVPACTARPYEGRIKIDGRYHTEYFPTLPEAKAWRDTQAQTHFPGWVPESSNDQNKELAA